MSTCYLTTPIYYANDRPHIGHAYTTIAADTLARYQRLHGRDVLLLTGTDEHGVNIERIAAQRGATPQQHVDAVADAFQALWTTLDIRHDRFVRTSQPAHTRAALALWQRLRQGDDLYRGTYTGTYCARCEAYYQEGELEGGLCPIHRLACERVDEENWFFRLSRYQDVLERLVRDTPFVQPEARRNEALGLLRQGVKDFSVTRRLVRWGIPVPDAPGEVLYVWVDALASYLTGAGFPDDRLAFERCWPADTHLIGKEILRFHVLYWPALLLSAGLPLPRRVFAHGWLTKDGQKISKTTGGLSGIDPAGLATEFGSDAVRYYFLRAIPFGQDGDFTRRDFVARYNADLAKDFGNLVQRATGLAGRAACRSADGARRTTAPLEEPEQRLRAHAAELPGRVAAAIETLSLHEALGAIGAFVAQTNRYLEATAPWQLARLGQTDRLALVLDHVVEATRLAAWYYAPSIPRGATEAHRRLTGHPPGVGGGVFCAEPRPVSAGPALFPRAPA